MGSFSGNIFRIILEVIRALFGKKPSPDVRPEIPANNTTEPALTTTSRVLLLVYDPVMDSATGETLIELQNWHQVDELLTPFLSDIQECSNNLARYQIIERIDIDDFPAKTDGYRYTPSTYLDVLSGGAAPHMPQEADYYKILFQFEIPKRITNNEIDEVWIFGFPHAGFFESIMGGNSAFWCNAPALTKTNQIQRRFVIMGFSYERHVGEMLEAFGHRAESIMAKTFEKLRDETNLWEHFTRVENTHPGEAEVGTIHFAPNSEKDYDWNNTKKVKSNCYDWYNFPEFQGDIQEVNHTEWGQGEIRAHHLWWLKHIPKTKGRLSSIHNNWWQYIIDPNQVTI
ncbi:MAG: hypothetical protein JXA13_17505 [Anaerolineales bacterium]|nr:hypothetical protein [Anaerolineales bacterium]